MKSRIANLLRVEPTLEGLREGEAGLTEQGGRRRGCLETRDSCAFVRKAEPPHKF